MIGAVMNYQDISWSKLLYNTEDVKKNVEFMYCPQSEIQYIFIKDKEGKFHELKVYNFIN